MIEPPGKFFRCSVFEIDYGVLIRIKQREVKQVAWTVQQSGVVDFSFGMNPFFIEARESRCGSDTVEAVTVIQEAKVHLQRGGVIINHFKQGSIFPAGVPLTFEAINLSTSSSINSP